MPLLLLEAYRISKYLGERKVLEFESFKLYEGDRVGVVGANGSGKTTLMKILNGELASDSGTVKRHCGVAQIPQFGTPPPTANRKELGDWKVVHKQSAEQRSGGEETRLKIAAAFAGGEELLFADEPTANLDMEGVSLFCKKMMKMKSFLLISHDRSVLEQLCNKIVEVKDGRLVFYEGGFHFYQEQSALAHRQAWEAYEQYAEEKRHLEDALRDRAEHAQSVKKAPSRMGNSEARLHKRSATEKQEKLFKAKTAIETRLEKLKVKEKPREMETIRLDFSLTDPPRNKTVVRCENLSFSYGEHVVFNGLNFEIKNGSRTAVIGPNGCGKTTLLNLIYQAYPGITTVPKTKYGYFYQGFDNIDLKKSVLDNVMEESVQNERDVRTILARLLLKREDVFKPAAILSGGERIKLSFAKLFVSPANILLLDEPTNYLDMPSLDALQDILCGYEGTILFVSHDRKFANSVADRLLILNNQTAIQFEGSLSQYKSRQTAIVPDKADMSKTILDLKITEVLSKLSLPNAKRDLLEAEYQMLINQRKKLCEISGGGSE